MRIDDRSRLVVSNVWLDADSWAHNVLVTLTRKGAEWELV